MHAIDIQVEIIEFPTSGLGLKTETRHIIVQKDLGKHHWTAIATREQLVNELNGYEGKRGRQEEWILQSRLGAEDRAHAMA